VNYWYCDRCDRDVALDQRTDRGDGVMWCKHCVDNYDPTPWEINSEENWPRDEAHRMEQARRLK